MNWRTELDPVLKEHCEELIKEVSKEKYAYKVADKPSRAQLWTALAVLTKKVSDLELRIKQLEKSQSKVENKKLKKNLKKF
jgi:hypothetical protein